MNLRPAEPADFPSVLALNEASVHFLSPLSAERLARLDREAALHVVIERAGEVVGFLLALRERANYDSVNYEWFERRYPSFLYIDRVVVGRNTQSEGAGSLLYKRAFAHAQETGIPILACEFDIDPPNPASERFHAKFGFREVGRQRVANGKSVSLQIAAACEKQVTYTIRRAIPEDAPAMLDLQLRAFAEEGRRSGSRDIPPLTEVLDAVIEHIQKQTALIASDNGKIIGTIRGIVDGRVCTVRALAVDPEHHGRGVGSVLLQALERALSKVVRFDLTTNTVMERNVSFYERHGYRVIELTPHSDLVTLAQMTKVVHGDA